MTARNRFLQQPLHKRGSQIL